MNVTIRASASGTAIFKGDKLVNLANGRRYECALTGAYVDGQEMPVVQLDVHLAECTGGEVLTWESPRPGCAPEATVTKPLTRADFDRLERKIDELSTRLDKRDAEASDFVRKSSDMSMSADLLLKALGIPMPTLSVTVTNAPS